MYPFTYERSQAGADNNGHGDRRNLCSQKFCGEAARRVDQSDQESAADGGSCRQLENVNEERHENEVSRAEKADEDAREK